MDAAGSPRRDPIRHRRRALKTLWPVFGVNGDVKQLNKEPERGDDQGNTRHVTPL